MFQGIIGHRTDSTIRHDPEIQLESNHHMTSRWEICISWEDGSTSWHSLSDIKNSYPIHLAEYAISNSLENLPAFRWQVKHTIKKKQRIIKTT
jgi:hypothetical protein